MQKQILLTKNVYLVIKQIKQLVQITLFFIGILILLQCSDKKVEGVLIPFSKISIIDVPESVPITYRGYKIGEAHRSKEKDIYYFILTEPNVSIMEDSQIILQPTNMFNTDFEFSIDTIVINEQVINIDTLKYHYTSIYPGNEKINNILHSIKNVFEVYSDTLDTVNVNRESR